VKRKISFILIGSVFLATPCFALFGEDLAALAQLISQGIQMVALANKAKSNFEQAAAFIKNPGGWKNILARGGVLLDQASNGSDNVALQRINESIRASQRVYAEVSSQPPSLANMAALSALSLQQVEAKNQADQLAESLQINDELRIARQHESWGCISCTMQRRKQ
jgi:hypothetical protein